MKIGYFSEKEFDDWWKVHESEYGMQCGYWLRSPCESLTNVASVSPVGHVNEDGDFVDFNHVGVRIALWVNM